MVKNLPAMKETWILSLGQENPLDKEMASTLVLLPGKFMGRGTRQKESDTAE